MALKTYKPLPRPSTISETPKWIADLDDDSLLRQYQAFGRSDSCGTRVERQMIAEVELELKQRKLLRA
jgi:hypothetical protein